MIKYRKILFLLISITFLNTSFFSGSDTKKMPVTPEPSVEAVELLNYIYSISGKQTLSGQHCNPLVGSTRLAGIQKHFGIYPVIFGQDFGFSEPGTWDGINFRQDIVDEAIRRYTEGFIVTLMWHAVPPTQDEPVDFRQSIQGDLTDKEWDDLITPGTEINERWKSQVDVIAFFLKQLRNAGIPVLWRPYHEMNGGWFWWGKKQGDNGYKKLYRMLYSRLVNFHKLNNLIWVFNANEIKFLVDPFEDFYPGDDAVDILAIDVYTQGFDSLNYSRLLKLAGDKPIALGEVGKLPSKKILKEQPKWTWFMAWGDVYNNRTDWGKNKELYDCEQVVTLYELPWFTIKKPVIHYPIIK